MVGLGIQAQMLKHKIDTEYIYNKLYTEKLATVKLRAYLTTQFKMTPNGVGYLINTKEDVEKYNATVFDISRGMVNIMAGIEEIKVWANFTEDVDGKVYVEIRSSGLNINQVAVKFGGGGHLQASGCTIDNLNMINSVIEELNKVVKGETNV